MSELVGGFQVSRAAGTRDACHNLMVKSSPSCVPSIFQKLNCRDVSAAFAQEFWGGRNNGEVRGAWWKSPVSHHGSAHGEVTDLQKDPSPNFAGNRVQNRWKKRKTRRKVFFFPLSLRTLGNLPLSVSFLETTTGGNLAIASDGQYQLPRGDCTITASYSRLEKRDSASSISLSAIPPICPCGTGQATSHRRSASQPQPQPHGCSCRRQIYPSLDAWSSADGDGPWKKTDDGWCPWLSWGDNDPIEWTDGAEVLLCKT